MLSATMERRGSGRRLMELLPHCQSDCEKDSFRPYRMSVCRASLVQNDKRWLIPCKLKTYRKRSKFTLVCRAEPLSDCERRAAAKEFQLPHRPLLGRKSLATQELKIVFRSAAIIVTVALKFEVRAFGGWCRRSRDTPSWLK